MTDEPINPRRYPSNSKSSKIVLSNPAEKKRIEPITTVRVKKPGLIDRAAQAFFGEDAESVVAYVLRDVLIPAAKNTISEMVSSGIEMLLFGEPRRRSDRNRGANPYVNYGGRYAQQDRDPRAVTGNNYVRQSARNRYNFDDYVFPSRGAALDVIENLALQIEEFGFATVGDFFDMIEVASDYTDNDYCWRTMQNVAPIQTRDGFIIPFTRPMLVA